MSTLHVRRGRVSSRARAILLVGALPLATACRSDEEPPRDTAPSGQETTASIDAVSDRVLETLDREVVVLVNRYDEQTSDGGPVDQIVGEALCG